MFDMLLLAIAPDYNLNFLASTDLDDFLFLFLPTVPFWRVSISAKKLLLVFRYLWVLSFPTTVTPYTTVITQWKQGKNSTLVCFSFFSNSVLVCFWTTPLCFFWALTFAAVYSSVIRFWQKIGYLFLCSSVTLTLIRRHFKLTLLSIREQFEYPSVALRGRRLGW